MNIFKKNKIITANEFINIKDIRGQFLYTLDNKIMSFIKINSINLQLLSKKEQLQKAREITSELSSINKELKFYSLARPIDVSFLITDLKSELNNTTDVIRKNLLKRNISETLKLTMTGEVVERQNFLIIYENLTDFSERELQKRCIDLINKFSNCGIKGQMLEETEIIQLCNSFTNSSYAFKENSNYNDIIPTLKSEV